MPEQSRSDELRRLERTEDRVIVYSQDYPAGYHVPQHCHRRSQFLCAFSGVILVETDRGHFMTPPGYALLIPPRLEHSVAMLTDVTTNSVYISATERPFFGERPVIVGMTELMRNLIVEAVALGARQHPNARKLGLVKELLVEEVLELEERPLALPFPADRRLSELCRKFLDRPSPYARIDDWAADLGMSRRTFTRFFRDEMNVSFVAWRQHASVLSCLPKLAEGEAVTTVALEAGYQSAAAFTTMFHRILGMTPRDYVANSRAFPIAR